MGSGTIKYFLFCCAVSPSILCVPYDAGTAQSWTARVFEVGVCAGCRRYLEGVQSTPDGGVLFVARIVPKGEDHVEPSSGFGLCFGLQHLRMSIDYICQV